MRALVLISFCVVASTGCRTRVARSEAPPPTTGYAVAVAAEEPAAVDLADAMGVHAQRNAYDLVPSSYLEHGYLTEGQEESFNTILEAGVCYRVLGVAGATLTDLDISMRDENGALIEEDQATDNLPVLGAGSSMVCPRWTGPFYVTARAFRGSGEYGIQVFRTP